MAKKTRFDLQASLEEFMGNKNVYFQPPEGFKMKYPCITYELSRIEQVYANNKTYLGHNEYSLTVIYREADATYKWDILKNFELISFDRSYKADNLYHDVFTIVW